jgi:hypothetical protein
MDENETVESMASKGGKAAAANMTPKERKERAKKAAAARWAKDVPEASHVGDLNVGGIIIPCAVVVVDGKAVRLLSETGLVNALGLYRSGAVHTRAKADAEEDGAQLPLFMAHKNLKPFIDDDLRSVLQEPVWYRPKGGGSPYKGLNATLIPKVCNTWLKARDAGVLGERQKRVAATADILVRALAEVAIVSLVDEATGYQDARDRMELARILQEFVAKEIREWVPTFDNDFYKMIFRLKNWTYMGTTRRPRMLGKITNDLVYRRLAPGLLAELQRLNPKDEKGNRKAKHHQWLTEHRGHPGLIKHLSRLTGWGEMSESWEQFMRTVNLKMPIYNGPTLFDGYEDPDDAEG